MTTILLLTAMTVQAVFGGLQDSVSICLGGGHAHEVTEVVEHCEFECSHHSSWPTPIIEDQDIDNCTCTDLELTLISLFALPKDNDSQSVDFPVFSNTLNHFVKIKIPVSLRGSLPPTFIDDPPALRQQLAVVCVTRLLI